MVVSTGMSRRQRLRAATLNEIKATARQLLVSEGPHSVTLRAIAREMGMTAPALYRYVPSHEDLLAALCADIYSELTDRLEAAEAQVDDAASRLMVLARTFRDWAVGHPAEFALIFGSPVPGNPDQTDPKHLAGMRFGAVWVRAFTTLWRQRPFPVPDDAALPAGLTGQLAAYRASLLDQVGADVEAMPLAAMQAFLECWAQLYGVVALETFDHLHFCLTDVGPFFDTFMVSVGRRLGIVEPMPPR